MKREFEPARKILAVANLQPGDELAVHAWLDAREGEIASATATRERLRAHGAKEKLPYCDTAMIETALGRFDDAFASLERGLQLRQ